MTKRAKSSTTKKSRKTKKLPTVNLSGDVVAVHIATSNTNLEKGFPPPICHKLVGFAAITVRSETHDVDIITQSDLDGEAHLLTTLKNLTREQSVVNFVPHRFTLPVLRGAAYRTGTRFSPEDLLWFDMGAWFGNGKTSMSHCAVATGLAPRHPIDVALAIKDGRMGDIEDQILTDAFSVLCMRLRQLVVEGDIDTEVYRDVVGRMRKKVRGLVKEKDLKNYVSWKGMLDKDRFLLKS